MSIHTDTTDVSECNPENTVASQRCKSVEISLPLALIWVVALSLGIQKANTLGEAGTIWLNEGTVIGGAIGGLIGLIIVLVLHRKAQNTNDRILLDIEADEE